MLREIAGAVRFSRAGDKNIIAGKPEKMPGGFVDLEALEQKNNFHAAGMGMRDQRFFGFAGGLDAERLEPWKLRLLGRKDLAVRSPAVLVDQRDHNVSLNSENLDGAV